MMGAWCRYKSHFKDTTDVVRDVQYHLNKHRSLVVVMLNLQDCDVACL